ncbi:MAG: hypothetical protein HQL53_12665, partial [Magnetococcales bacterium]|nr:hypothetical protein [Magnetococcales bacterium]
MAQSMTGFSQMESLTEEARIVWRLRSVNHRYLDLSLRLPERAGALEIPIRKRLQACFSRGRMECALSVEQDGAATAGLALDEALFEAVVDLESQARAKLHGEACRDSLSMDRLLTWPGMVRDSSGDRRDALWQDKGFVDAVMTALDRAMEEMSASRGREGSALVQVMHGLMDELQTSSDALRGLLPTIHEELEARLRQRVQELTELAPEASRLSQELAFYLNRMDLSE